jgi:hypothetical protein
MCFGKPKLPKQEPMQVPAIQQPLIQSQTPTVETGADLAASRLRQGRRRFQFDLIDPNTGGNSNSTGVRI